MARLTQPNQVIGNVRFLGSLELAKGFDVMNWQTLTNMLTAPGAIPALPINDNLADLPPTPAPIRCDPADPMGGILSRLMLGAVFIPAIVRAESWIALAPKLSIANLVWLEGESATALLASKFRWLYKLVVRLAIPDGRFCVLFGRTSSFIHALGVINAQAFAAAILFSIPFVGRNHHCGSADNARLGLLCVFAHAYIIPQFNGSGTTGAVALKHGRQYIGCELNADYIELAHRRIQQSQPMLLEAI